jgi:phosphate transport system permease protein
MSDTTAANSIGTIPQGEEMQRNIRSRRTVGNVWRSLFFSSLVIGVIALLTLLWTVIDDSFGLVAVQNTVNPAELSAQPLESLSKEALTTILQENVSAGLFRRLDRDQAFEQRTKEDILALIYERVVEQKIVRTYSLGESLFNRSAIEADVAEQFPEARLEFRSWLSGSFLTTPMSSKAEFSGIRTAILGSLWMIVITMLIAVPIGVCAALYLEEYAPKNRLTDLIETNINNLAGVPSIIYGMLGLAIFVRTLEYYTSGAFIGVTDTNGRTVISGSLTMALLILPLIIINAREAIRAVPQSLRQASYGLGATQWQTVWQVVIPNAIPGILTGTILGMSRAIGETAPLIVVGASTFIVSDPNGPFSKFTALPIQIYNWTQQPQPEFRSIAAAAIIVLLILLLSLNAAAIILRNRFRRSYS